MEISEQSGLDIRLAANARIDNEQYFNALMKKPAVAWPTVALFAAIVAGAILSTSAALSGWAPWSVAVLINTICSYAAYSVLHEASHGLVTHRRWLNDWIGRVSMAFVSLTPFFRTYRFLHMTHHRFTNDPEKDPDISCGGGRWWTLPLRWAVMDYAYVRTYLKPGNYECRPTVEKREFWLAIGAGVALLIAIAVTGWWFEFLVLYLVPTRISIVLLAITFDYLPHYPHDHTAAENKYRATNNRIGHEWLLTPLVIGHNYHLTHHLYPAAPFYRYRRLWEARKTFHESQNPGRIASFRLAPDRVAAPYPLRTNLERTSCKHY